MGIVYFNWNTHENVLYDFKLLFLIDRVHSTVLIKAIQNEYDYCCKSFQKNTNIHVYDINRKTLTRHFFFIIITIFWFKLMVIGQIGHHGHNVQCLAMVVKRQEQDNVMTQCLCVMELSAAEKTRNMKLVTRISHVTILLS